MKPTTFQYVITWGIVFTILLAVLVAIPLMVYFYLNKDGINCWNKNDDDKEKIERTSNRGTVISIFLTLMSLVQAILKGSGAAETPLLLLFGFIFASVVGYIGDQGFGIDDGYSFNDIVERANNDGNGVKDAPLFAQQVGTIIKFIMGKLLKGDFWRYIVTVFLDMFISMPIQIIITILMAPTINSMNLVSLSMGPFMKKITQLLTFNFDNVLQSFVAFITFLAYTNDTRFRWAYPGEVADRGSLSSTGTIKLATAVAAGFYLTSVVSTDNVTNTGLKPGSSLVDNLASKFIYVLFIISLMTIGSSMLSFMDSFSDSKYYAKMKNEYTKDDFWKTKTKTDEKSNDLFKEVKYNIYKRKDFKDKFDILGDYWKGILVFAVYLLLGFSLPFLPVKFIYGNKIANASWFKFTMSVVVVMIIVVILFLFTLASPNVDALRRAEGNIYLTDPKCN